MTFFGVFLALWTPLSYRGATATGSKMPCSADLLPCAIFHEGDFMESCFCAAKNVSKMARSISIGALWKTAGSRGGRVVQRHVLYLGELNGRQEASWQRCIDLFCCEGAERSRQVALFPEEHLPQESGREIESIGIRLSEMRLLKPRQWGACWLGCHLWEQLGLDEFWSERLPVGRQGARWSDILKTLAIYRLVSPEKDLLLLLNQLKITLPQQPPPKIYAKQLPNSSPPVVPTFSI